MLARCAAATDESWAAKAGERQAQPNPTWIEVLVDCPGAQGLYTYALPSGLTVQPGDIVSVPFGAQQVGAIAVRPGTTLPPDLAPDQVRPIASVVAPGFFPAHYWELVQRVADYYGTSLLAAVRVALPPGLLARSRRRIRITTRRPSTADPLATPAAQALWQCLQASKTGDYSWQFLQRQVPRASVGLGALLAAGWVESYLEPPAPVRPRQRQAVLLTGVDGAADLTPRQNDIVGVLQRHGGEMWLADLLQESRTTTATLKTLERKGVLVRQAQEVLRRARGPAQVRDRPQTLTPHQANALAAIQAEPGFREWVLHGVTGSGKTEVYLQAIAPVLARGQSALVLVPEIGLTPQLTDRFRARFGERVWVYHSALSDGERYDTWRQLLQPAPRVVIGTRSAVFAPLPNLGLIVLDEEHDPSFKQDQPAPCYHARTVARWRGELAACPVVLGSATPALETWAAATQAPTDDTAPRPGYLSLPARVQGRPVPPIEVVDLRQELRQGNRSLFGRSLQTALSQLQASGEQGILFIHRRGHSSFVSCRSCGEVMTCPHCDVSLTYHQPPDTTGSFLQCHYCNYRAPVPSRCPACDSTYFKQFGSGTQRVVAELSRLFPDLRALRFDSDTTRTKGSHRALLSRFAQKEADLLVGTQMLTKGLDLPQVTLVGIVAADGLLHFADYRASERAFQTLTQVAGRCGRGDRPGQVILQTYSPDHAVIQAVQRQDFAAFAQAELAQRAALGYPPHGQLILLRLSSPHPVAVQQAAERVAARLQAQLPPDHQLLGPAPATILRVARRFRWQLLLKRPARSHPLPDLTALQALCPRTVSLTMDVDPLTIG